MHEGWAGCKDDEPPAAQKRSAEEGSARLSNSKTVHYTRLVHSRSFVYLWWPVVETRPADKIDDRRASREPQAVGRGKGIACGAWKLVEWRILMDGTEVGRDEQCPQVVNDN